MFKAFLTYYLKKMLAIIVKKIRTADLEGAAGNEQTMQKSARNRGEGLHKAWRCDDENRSRTISWPGK